ncbi:hypothetical protein [Sporolactobacillus sp. CQH2019]|uniref:hypothetical protein n=1 Tax=Sporolactobacillus sp. CQH2019 TaxID=3023512 RepID=UPI002368B8F3|nr:hypothetical protein [Sporolactobacillus sp. CQH2019]
MQRVFRSVRPGFRPLEAAFRSMLDLSTGIAAVFRPPELSTMAGSLSAGTEWPEAYRSLEAVFRSLRQIFRSTKGAYRSLRPFYRSLEAVFRSCGSLSIAETLSVFQEIDGLRKSRSSSEGYSRKIS